MPDYLGSDFRVLEAVGYQLREEYGPTLKKYVKYDDENYGLVLELKFPEPDNKRWIRMTADTARDIRDSGNSEVLRGVETRMRRRSAASSTAASTTTVTSGASKSESAAGTAANISGAFGSVEKDKSNRMDDDNSSISDDGRSGITVISANRRPVLMASRLGM